MGKKLTKKRQAPKLTPPHREVWTNEELDTALEIALYCNTQSSYKRICSSIAKELHRGSVDFNGHVEYHSIDLILWKLASGYEKYRDYMPSSNRIKRKGYNRTWMERKLLNWAFNPSLDAQKERFIPPDDLFISGLLNRPIEEIKAFRKQMTERRGKGFGL